MHARRKSEEQTDEKWEMYPANAEKASRDRRSNLRLIWSPASEALSSLAQRFGNVVWDIIFSKLQQPQGTQEAPEWLTAIKDDENDMDPWEERSWRDPTAHKLRDAAANWLDKHYHCKIITSQVWQSKGSALHTLRELYRSIISYPDRALQTVSLSCLLAYKSPHLQHHEEKLRLLLDETKWRDELTSLHLSSIEIKDRPQLVDVIVRLLYGLTLERKGRSRGSNRRAAVLTASAGCTDQELSLLVDLMLKPMQSDSHACQDDMFSLCNIFSDVSLKQQSGYLTLSGDKQLSNVTAAEAVEQVENEADEEESEVGEVFYSTALRSVRQQGLKRLADFFRYPVEFDFTPYLFASFSDIVAPCLELLDQENKPLPRSWNCSIYRPVDQSIRCSLVQHDPRVLPKILDCLVAANIKPAVINRVFDIVERLLLYSADDSRFLDLLIQPYISQLLKNLTTLVERTKADAALSSPITQRQISLLSEVARYAGDSMQTLTLLSLLSPLLRKSSRIISEKVKVKLLGTLGHIFPLLTELSILDIGCFQEGGESNSADVDSWDDR
ncbi:down-regulated in metastasis-domain-containing protein [Suillus paluster]|uniref:down-regulated in metastasis-domain-containing protein n=1 Tax=Suillus paluster TaxID=48578 RepID=UPI001B86368D|nr:down-regulated in metastasis-domain-containing protein [Suillus paluster]KAG1739895.1 down-regulated in metastasis-domain-containing protein [Suillus paluster]